MTNRKTDEARQSNSLRVALTTAERARIDAQAKRERLPASTWVRRVVMLWLDENAPHFEVPQGQTFEPPPPRVEDVVKPAAELTQYPPAKPSEEEDDDVAYRAPDPGQV